MARKHTNISAALDGTVWAVAPDKLRAMAAVIDGISLDNTKPVAQDQEWDNVHQQPVRVIGGVAVVPVDGVMMRRANMFMSYSGGTSTDVLSAELRKQADDPNITGILLHINSPGGTVDGIDAVTRSVEYAASKKPVYSLADSAALSGGMWLGVTADKFFATPDALLGSIGVIATRYDFSEMMENEGVREHIFRAGQYKALGQQSEPLSEDEVTEEDRILNNYYSLFVNHVATHRGISNESVIDTQARVYGAQEALSLNLIDAVKTFDEALSAINAEAETKDQLATAQTEMQSGFTARDAEIERLRAENASLTEKVSALDADHAKLVADTRAAKIDAAVTKLTVEDKKVLPNPEAEAKLRERLAADFDGTMAAMELVPVNAAAPQSAPAIEASAEGDATGGDLIAQAAKRGVPVVQTKAGAAVYESAGMEYVDASGPTPVLKNQTTGTK